MPNQDLYETLGVNRNASKEDIKRQYKKLAIQNHPDKGGDTEAFKEIAHAYAILGDDDKRKRYDAYGDETGQDGPGPGPGAGFDPNSMFEQFFGGAFGGAFGGMPFMNMQQQGHARACSDSLHRVGITLREAYMGCTKHIRVGLTKPCVKCKETCFVCQGKGTITNMKRMGMFTQMITQACQECEGKGVTFKGKKGCPVCDGKGDKREEHSIDFVLAPGVESGHRKVYKGMGEQSSADNVAAGDLILEVHVNASENGFVRQGNDLHHRVKLTLLQSIVGASIVIDHFKSPIPINTCDFGVVQPNVPYIVPNKGMPVRAAPEYGSMVLTFDIEYPKKPLSSEVRTAINAAWV